jgi:hypothetical protein
MKCELCSRTATEKHHVTYYPEVTIAVCAFHGDEIHRSPSMYPALLQYPQGESTQWYSQEHRISKFLRNMGKHRKGRRR